MTKAQIEHETSVLTLEDLQEIERTQDRTSDRPAHLPLSDFRIANEVFQWRQFVELAAEENHVKELLRVLKATKAPLDPILVVAIGSDFFVVDGHHRLLAYHRAEWDTLVPVTHFDGSVEDAWLEALSLNSKNKLPMTYAEKAEAAWKLVKAGEMKFSKSDIHRRTSISESTIASMRRTLREHPSTFEMDWKVAKRYPLDKPQDFDREEWLDASAEKMAKQLIKSLGPKLGRRSDVLALALSKINSDLPAQLVREWPDEVREFAKELAVADELDI